MSRTIIIVGFGPGISMAVAEKFGSEGFSVVLVARSPDRLAEGVASLKAKGIAATSFVADAGDPDSIASAVGKAREAFGPLNAIHWNAFGAGIAGNLLATDPGDVSRVFDVAIVGLLAAVQAAAPDLKATKGAVLVTNGAFGYLTPAMDALAVSLKSMGVALGNAAKAKLVGLLSESLKDDGIYVGEVTVAGAVKGTAWAGEGGIEGERIANLFWSLYQGRGEMRAMVA